ncbi:MAG: spermidine synthase [Candidatus Sphingomonas colombiensis]|nr:spermidine synthase [Sphingomonas sp.]WEK42466.1 MAG: spermidine synthase [Sphingomonas sp.]
MKPIELIDAAEIPGGGQLRLLRCGTDFAIQFGEDELMGSTAFDTEEALATLAISRLGSQRDRILIGGLGMGFTLRAALSSVQEHTSIVVAELVPGVVTWARGPLAHLFGDCLADPRVSIAICDVHDFIADSPLGFDAIMLDVDNGPDGFIRDANDRLYCDWGLRSTFAALRPGGVLAIWSAYDDPAFVGRLNKAGFTVEEARIDDVWSRVSKHYTIWLASKPMIGSGS